MTGASPLIEVLERVERGLLSISGSLPAGCPVGQTARELYFDVFNALQDAAGVDLQIIDTEEEQA